MCVCTAISEAPLRDEPRTRTTFVPPHLPPCVRHVDVKPGLADDLSFSYFFICLWDLVGPRGQVVNEKDEAGF